MDLEHVTLIDLERAMAEADRVYRRKLDVERHLTRRRLVARATGVTQEAIAALTLEDWPEYEQVDELEAQLHAAVVRIEVLVHLLRR